MLADSLDSKPTHLDQIINLSNAYGRTPIFAAVEYNDVERTQLLLQLGADVTVRDLRGKTTLSIADKRSEVYKIVQQAFKAAEENAKRIADAFLETEKPVERQKATKKKQPKSHTSSSAKKVTSAAERTELTPDPAAPSSSSSTSSTGLEHGQRDSQASSSADGPAWTIVGAKKPKGSLSVVTASPTRGDTLPSVPSSPVKVPQVPADLPALNRALDKLHPQATNLDLQPGNLFGIGLDNLSMAQLTVLEEIHRDQLTALGDAKVTEAKRQERFRVEEEGKIARQIQELRGKA